MKNSKLNKLSEAIQLELSYNEENKALFKKTSTAFLREIGKKLGLSTMKVSFNAGGIAVAGDPSLYGMWSDRNGIAIYIQGEPSYGRQNVLYRSITHMKDFSGGHNQWTSLDVGEDELLHLFSSLKKAA